MADYAEELLAKRQAFALPEVIAEIIYVLMKVYKVSRTEIVNQVKSLLEYADTYNPDVMRYALSIFAEEDVLLQCLFPQFHRQNCLQKCVGGLHYAFHAY